MEQGICCFIGHRNISETEELESKLYGIVEDLIISRDAKTFLFGSKSQFNNLCYNVVSSLKGKYPYIKRVYVRAEFPIIPESYEEYLLGMYEATYYPQKINNAGKAAYIERNVHMIDESQICVVYYSEECLPSKRKSGTKIALDYAMNRKKEIIRLE